MVIQSYTQGYTQLNDGYDNVCAVLFLFSFMSGVLYKDICCHTRICVIMVILKRRLLWFGLYWYWLFVWY